ncbi:MAG: tRNA (adenosine(37)-N6)-dimethylallyltransferase MiaA [Sphingomonadales bacterium]|nr:tRNA (adenosine(37)-N6)-dimethylallyltransferase MiaA [Sphingomonadales bacterium]
MSTLKSPESADRPPLALIAGPTASGKSDCAIRLALALRRQGKDAVVINADSAQVYRDLAALSARPSEAEMQGVEHRLFGEWDGAETCSAADWAKRAREIVADLHARSAIPILVGGTGLYLRTLLDGIAPIPPIDPAVRAAVRAMSVAAAHQALQAEDPRRAAMLAPADTARVARALEVVRSTGRSMLDWQHDRVGGIGAVVALHARLLLPPRDWLYTRCDQRFAHMLAGGALDEVTRLLDRKLDPTLPVMRAIGVPELAALLAGSITHAEAEARGAQATRNYAKRQYTWFRNQPPRDWARLEAKDVDITDAFASLLRI